MKAKHEYRVTATKDVVDEMARYDEAEAKRGAFVRLGSIKPITDETEAINRCRNQDERDSRLYYHWILTSDYAPSVDRWASFGIRVEEDDSE